ncbi:MAG: hypothetical protein GY696_16275 [Gammaproteobacteria bacterium]|nr:hypothetical protein [Gammaproteobacteria bacterium]
MIPARTDRTDIDYLRSVIINSAHRTECISSQELAIFRQTREYTQGGTPKVDHSNRRQANCE